MIDLISHFLTNGKQSPNQAFWCCQVPHVRHLLDSSYPIPVRICCCIQSNLLIKHFYKYLIDYRWSVNWFESENQEKKFSLPTRMTWLLSSQLVVHPLTIWVTGLESTRFRKPSSRVIENLLTFKAIEYPENIFGSVSNSFCYSYTVHRWNACFFSDELSIKDCSKASYRFVISLLMDLFMRFGNKARFFLFRSLTVFENRHLRILVQIFSAARILDLRPHWSKDSITMLIQARRIRQIVGLKFIGSLHDKVGNIKYDDLVFSHQVCFSCMWKILSHFFSFPLVIFSLFFVLNNKC